MSLYELLDYKISKYKRWTIITIITFILLLLFTIFIFIKSHSASPLSLIGSTCDSGKVKCIILTVVYLVLGFIVGKTGTILSIIFFITSIISLVIFIININKLSKALVYKKHVNKKEVDENKLRIFLSADKNIYK